MESYVDKISAYDGEKFAMFPLERMQDAVSAYVAVRWPVGRRKSVEREWGLNPYQAKTVCDGSVSAETLNLIWNHKNGGWKVIVPVFGALLGKTVEQHIIEERRSHVEQARRLGSLVRDSWSGGPDTRDAADQLAASPGSGRRAVRQ